MVTNTKKQIIQSFFLDTLPTPVVTDIVLEVLLGGTSSYLEIIVAWMITEYINQFMSSSSILQVKFHIYKSLDQNKFLKSVKAIRKKILQREKAKPRN